MYINTYIKYILNNQTVIDAVNKLNGRWNATSVSCFNFSNRYTKILHDKLLKVLNELIDFCIKGGGGEFISVNGYGLIGQKKEGQNL